MGVEDGKPEEPPQPADTGDEGGADSGGRTSDAKGEVADADTDADDSDSGPDSVADSGSGAESAARVEDSDSESSARVEGSDAESSERVADNEDTATGAHDDAEAVEPADTDDHEHEPAAVNEAADGESPVTDESLADSDADNNERERELKPDDRRWDGPDSQPATPDASAENQPQGTESGNSVEVSEEQSAKQPEFDDTKAYEQKADESTRVEQTEKTDESHPDAGRGRVEESDVEPQRASRIPEAGPNDYVAHVNERGEREWRQAAEAQSDDPEHADDEGNRDEVGVARKEEPADEQKQKGNPSTEIPKDINTGKKFAESVGDAMGPHERTEIRTGHETHVDAVSPPVDHTVSGVTGLALLAGSLTAADWKRVKDMWTALRRDEPAMMPEEPPTDPEDEETDR